MDDRRKTCVRYNTPWDAHALTFSCFQRRHLLEANHVKQAFVEALANARECLRFDLWAYVIMPEHAHVILWPREEVYSISRILSAIKRPFSFRVGLAGRQGLPHFWQEGGGYDRNLRKVKTIHREIKYVHDNPVLRGLCPTPTDWRYSSAAFWAGEKDVPLVMDGTVPPGDGS